MNDKSIKNKIMLFGILLPVLICICLLQSSATQAIDLQDTMDVHVELEEFASVDLDANSIELLIFVGDSGEQSAEVTGSIASNTPINIKFATKSQGFDNQLDDWITYYYTYNSTTVSFDPGNDDTEIEINGIGPGKLNVVIEAVFDREKAYSEEWWNLEAGLYSDEKILTISAISND